MPIEGRILAWRSRVKWARAMVEAGGSRERTYRFDDAALEIELGPKQIRAPWAQVQGFKEARAAFLIFAGGR